MVPLATYPGLRRALRRGLKIAGGICAALLLLLLALFGALQLDWARDEIRDRIAAATAGSGTAVTIDSIDGVVPFDMELRGIAVADPAGTWLTVDRLALQWSPGALFAGALRIDDLGADLVRVARIPQSPQKAEAAGGFSLPSLPLDIDLRRARIARLDLAAPVLGAPASLGANAEAALGRWGEAASLTLSLQQLAGQAGSADIALAYRPDADFLQLDAQVLEPQGGLIGRLLGLPQGSDLRVTAKGTGALTDWHGTALAELDGASILDLEATVSGAAPRRIAFTLDATPPPALLPDKAAALVAGGIHADGALRYDRATAALQVERFAAAAAAGRIEASGRIGERDGMDLAVAVVTAGSAPFSALLPDIAWSSGRIDATLKGTPEKPKLTARAVLRDFAVPQARIDTLAFDLAADAAEGLDAPIAIKADATASSVTPADARLAPLLTEDVRLSLAGSAATDGALVATQLGLRGAGIELSAQGRAEDWGASVLSGEGSLAIADIALLNELSGLQGRGALDLALRADPAAGGSHIEILATGNELSLGLPQIDRLLGPAPQLSLSFTLATPLRVTIEQAEVTGAKAAAVASGTIAEDALDVKMNGTLDDLGALDPAAAGQLAVDAMLTGTLDAPDLALQGKSAQLTYGGRAIEHLTLEAAIRNLHAPHVEAKANAQIAGLPAAASVTATMQAGAINGEAILLRLGRATLNGAIVYGGQAADGKLRLEAPDLSELRALAGLPLGGSLSGDLTLSAVEGRQNAAFDATVQALAIAGQFSATHGTASLRLGDLFGAPTVTGGTEFTAVSLAGRSLDTLRLSADGSLRDLRAELTATGKDLDLAAAAAISVENAETRITLDKLDGTYRDVAWRSGQPADLLLGPDLIQLKNLALSVEGGALHAEGTLRAETVDAGLRLEKIPLSLLRLAAPELKIAGALDGELRLSGAVAAPDGVFILAATDVTMPGMPQSADLKVQGKLNDGALDVTGATDLGAQGRLDFAVALPSLSSNAALRASAKGTLDLVLLDAFLAGGADRVRGQAALDLAFAGTLAAPEASGSATLQGVEYDNLRYGVTLRQIAAELRAEGRRVEIVSLTARGPGGGSLNGTGTVELGGGIGIDLALSMSRLRAIDTQLASAVIDGDLALRGDLATRLALQGAIEVREAEIRVPDSLPPDVQEIAVVEVNLPPDRQAADARQQQAPPQSLDLDLDVAVEAPRRIFVRGRGLDAELGGKLQIGGGAAAPDIAGALNLRRGTFEIAGKRLEFDHGVITFESGTEINPLLDFTATSKSADLVVTVKVEGPAKTPRITLSSVPALPQDEILARLLFDKSVGALSPFELLQLAQATAQLSGIRSGPGILDKIREGTGLDRLTLEEAEGGTGPSLGAGRYVADGVYVGVSQGAQSNSSAATVEIEITPNVKLESELGANGSGKTGVNLEWDY